MPVHDSCSHTRFDSRVENLSPWMTTKQAADYLSISHKSLELWRASGNGPVFRRIGKRIIRYHVRDLDEFLKASERPSSGDVRSAD